MGIISDSLRAGGCIIVNKNQIYGIGLNEAICFSELLARFEYFQERGQLQADGSFRADGTEIRLARELISRILANKIASAEAQLLLTRQTGKCINMWEIILSAGLTGIYI